MTLLFAPHGYRGVRPPSLTQVNWRSPQAKNLYAWWPIDYGFRPPTFEMVRAEHGDESTGITARLPRSLLDGRIGQEVLSTGSTVETPRNMNTYLSTSEGMISVWVMMIEAAPSVTNLYDGRAIWGESGQWLGLYASNIAAGDRIWAYNFDTNVDAVGSTYTLFTLDNYAWVHTGGNLYLFKNGLPIGSTASGNTGNALGVRMFIGATVSQSAGDCVISDFRVYNPVPNDFERIIFDIWNPKTRFDLYYPPGRRIYVNVVAAAAPASFLPLPPRIHSALLAR